MNHPVQWRDLPSELLGMIAQRLESHINVLRFRCVCTSWRRSFIPPFGNISSPSFLKFSFPVPPTRQPFLRFCTGFTVSESTVYRLEPSLEIENPSSSSSSSKGWLVRLKEEEEPNKMRMLSPLADVPIQFLPPSFPKILNLLDFRISEIHKSYRPQCLFLFQMAIFPPYVSKLAVLPSNAVPTPTDNYVFMMIYDRGRLRFMKSGDEEWTAIEEDCSNYSDVISYKGQFYAVNKTGRAVVVDRFLKVTEIASPLCDGGEGERKHLVESCGDLLLVDGHEFPLTVARFKVYKLNEEEHNWVEVRSLGDQVLFVGDDCSFAASAQDFAGCKGNCIYYTDQWWKTSRHYSPFVFDLEDGSRWPLASCPGYSDIFWPLAEPNLCGVRINLLCS